MEKEEQQETQKGRFGREIREWIVALAVALALAIFITQVIIVNARVPTGSMEPTIMTGDRVIGFRPAYWFKSPERGDIIIFRYPDDETQLYVKRVIGMPGESLEIREGKIYLNGDTEPFVVENSDPAATGNFGPFQVPPGHYFVMGDNRNNSWDSRYWQNTYVPENNILGEAVFRLWPSPGALS